MTGRPPPPEGLPVVDVAALAEPAGPAAKPAAAALLDAFERVGFAYVEGHGIPPAVVEAAFAASRAFHAQPLDARLALRVNAFHRGYLAMATSTLRTSSVARVSRPNLSESLMLMHAVGPGDPEWGRPLQGPNQWPDGLPGFRSAVETYEAALRGLAERLLAGFALGLGLPADWFGPMFRRPVTFLRLLRYPPQPADAPDGQYGAAPHTDYGALTLLAQDGTEGLEVRSRAGEWLSAPPLPGRFLVNVGDLMPAWSNGRVVSTPHRVLNRSGRDRYSIAYFFDPAMDSTIDCLPTCVGAGDAPARAPFRYGDYLLDRLERNYPYRRPVADGGITPP